MSSYVKGVKRPALGSQVRSHRYSFAVLRISFVRGSKVFFFLSAGILETFDRNICEINVAPADRDKCRCALEITNSEHCKTAGKESGQMGLFFLRESKINLICLL